ncbi:hypothetical protein CAPTEDRAFT_192010 [Capitella teleta]|uniref:Uncharacterized protein n=1 Tax=Capitella teleta TaxID=283909 RepID=R7TA48_CAPTE|nr:hypothetical protein CAPTEDRAFT_192010 [Capitella teleta]|eukprot:ELT90623.1 hypothetical protein CAPTEDRAFT_192010 [Capitella teleta]
MLLNLVLLFILYKILDYVIRIPFISNVDRKKIMVTGCDSGFGRLFAIRMANKGVTVFASCMTDDGKKQLEQSSTNIKAFIMDITDVDSVQKAYEFVTGHLASNEGLWGILNNAGFLQQMLGPLEWQSADEFKKVLDVNVVGHHNVTKTFLPLVKRSCGRLAFTSSAAAHFPEPLMNLYVASKHALDGYVSCIRPDLKAFGISSHLIEPGVKRTPMVCQAYEKVDSYEVPDDVTKEYPKEFLEKHAAYVRDVVDGYATPNCDDVLYAFEHALFGLYPRARYSLMLQVKAFMLLPEYALDYIYNHRNSKPQPHLIY